jgi:oligopeptide transport system ATP-binding protein
MGIDVLQLRQLEVRFWTRDGVVAAVNGLSLAVGAGEVVGLVGESGCGKSTTALSIMQLLPKQGHIVSGQIILDGQDIVPLRGRQLRALRGPKVAMIFQDALAALDPTMTVGRQLMEPLQEHLGLSTGAARQRAVELLTKVGIPAPERRMNDYSFQFSGGMRQRVMIAIALSCSPKLLLADEPTTALDVTVQRQILDLILDLRDETGAGVLLITHDVGVVAETCDRVVVMYAGRAVETGPCERVFRDARHPYTVGLLGSSLRLAKDRGKPLPAIPGMPPDLIELPPGCPFAPRCERVIETCLTQTPEIVQVSTEHGVACWNMERGHGAEC